jgi:hypothetical protein
MPAKSEYGLLELPLVVFHIIIEFVRNASDFHRDPSD